MIDESHPSWVCGLKHWSHIGVSNYSMSHPSWVCGLKHQRKVILFRIACHTLRGCVD